MSGVRTPGDLRIHAGRCRRRQGVWFAEVSVSDGKWKATAKARASGPGIAVRRAVDTAIKALREQPECPETT